MSEVWSLLGWAGGGVVTVAGIVFAIRKLWQLFRPINVEAGAKLTFDKSCLDEIQTKILNRSRETQYVVRCVARSAYPLSTIVWKHLKNPLVPPRLYPTIWFSAISFDLLGPRQVKLDPFERTELSYQLSSRPLQLFLTSKLQVEVELSTHRIFRSSRLTTPERWRFKGKSANRHQSPPEAQQGAPADRAKRGG